MLRVRLGWSPSRAWISDFSAVSITDWADAQMSSNLACLMPAASAGLSASNSVLSGARFLFRLRRALTVLASVPSAWAASLKFYSLLNPLQFERGPPVRHMPICRGHAMWTIELSLWLATVGECQRGSLGKPPSSTSLAGAD